MKISEFTYGGVQLRYNPETGECWRRLRVSGWKLITPGNDAGASYLVPQALQLIDSCDYLRPELTPVGLALCIL